MRVGLGVSDHSGWAVLVALGGDAAAPVVLMRRRLQLIDPALPRQVYHAVAEQGRPRALIEEVVASAARESRRELQAVLAELGSGGHEVVGIGIPGAPVPAPALERILASHALLHGAEGQLYRNALAGVAEAVGLSVTRFLARELEAVAGARLGLAAEVVRARVADLGRALGPPWAADQKRGATAGWLALGAAESRRGTTR